MGWGALILQGGTSEFASQILEAGTHNLSSSPRKVTAEGGVLGVQGIVGSIPWSAMVYLTLYFQLMGMTDFAASLQMSLLLGSTAVGGLLGGWVGDKAAARYPDHGRLIICQFSVAVGIPFSIIVTKVYSPLSQNLTHEMKGGAGRRRKKHLRP